jgi:dienelactone hydrolase
MAMNTSKFTFLFLLFIVFNAQSEIVQKTISIPIKLTLTDGKVYSQEIETVIWTDNTKINTSTVILGHGSFDKTLSNFFWVSTHSDIAKKIVGLGFNVIFPIRVGAAQGPLVEKPACEGQNYQIGFDYIADQYEQVIEYVKFGDIIPSEKIIVIGISTGGGGVLALGSRNNQNISALVNFIGGNGGGFGNGPCEQEQLNNVIGTYGKTSRQPMLWLYALNDRWWGKDLPVKWHNSFKESGGNANFIMTESKTFEGHFMIHRSPEVWVPILKDFLDTNNLP